MVSYWERWQLWCMAWRDSTMLGHNTNNYCESTIWLYKDIVLGRCKAYNIVTLVDFTCTIMEDYYRRRLRLFSQARVHKPRLVLESLVRKAAYVSSSDIVKVDDLYSVPSEKNSSLPTENHMFYMVSCNVGTCTCDAAKSGQFCKHQAAVWKLTGTSMPSMPPVSSEDRHQMAVLARGEHAEDVAFYRDFLQPMETQSTTITASASTSTHVSIQASHEYTDNVAPDVGKSIIKEVVEKMLLFSESFQ